MIDVTGTIVEMFSHWFIQVGVCDVREVSPESGIHCCCSLSNILFMTFCTRDHIDHIKTLTIVSSFDRKSLFIRVTGDSGSACHYCTGDAWFTTR